MTKPLKPDVDAELAAHARRRAREEIWSGCTTLMWGMSLAPLKFWQIVKLAGLDKEKARAEIIRHEAHYGTNLQPDLMKQALRTAIRREAAKGRRALTPERRSEIARDAARARWARREAP